MPTEIKWEDLKDHIGKKVITTFENKEDSFRLHDFKEDRICIKKGYRLIWYKRAENHKAKYFIND